VCRGDEVYINAAVALQFEHGLGQLLDCNLTAVPLMTDIIVLAENTTQVTTCEKDCAGASPADEHALFSEVRADGTYYWFVTYAAKADFTLAALDFTLTRTECARIHQIP
jgi:hypothetical protein